MAGYVVELPLRWKTMDLKPYLPIYTKIGYGIMLNAITDLWLLTSGVDRKKFDPGSIVVVKHFIGYMNTMDDYLDAPENKHKQRPSLRFTKGDELWERRKEMFGSIEHYDVPRQKKIKRAICASADRLLSAFVRFRSLNAIGFDDALHIREETAGELCRVTAELFNVIHDVPSDRARAVETAFWNVGMVLQVHDDVGDICKDDREGFGENMVLQLLNQRPEEKARLMGAIAHKKNCPFSKIERYAPETARAARELQDRYMAAIPDTGGFERIRCLLDLTVSMRGRSAALRSIIDKMEL
ncbi:hypothetical protein RM2 [Methanocella arvoryzae MRE50]|uniref:Uncharacterized protein n=1 Tax=Methanocella arvoryzae (strain DSM 22066 / NBRC 105507 / MRE50) TaxID=351160 RepID=Q0W076_METAR|nr:hypothetical protein RM2 [Methanocella arvoryzae MRE50]